MSRKNKSISFDLTDEYEKKLLEHAESQGKFSRYIKRLIDRDMMGLGQPATAVPTTLVVADEAEEVVTEGFL